MKYKQALKDIDEIVNTDWLAGLESRHLTTTDPIDQDDARRLLYLQLKVYSISHCDHCVACRSIKGY